MKKNEITEINSFDIENIELSDITIIIPTLNEENAIGLVLNDLQVNGYENLLVVDGGSSDNTLNEILKHNVKVIPQEGKGKTGAIKTAINFIDTRYFALIDGDCTYKAEDLEKLYSRANQNTQIIGSRTNGRENIPFLNRFGNLAINTLFNVVFGTKLFDVCSGMYVLPTSFAQEIPFETEGFDVEVEIAAYASKNGNIQEIPIGYYTRVGQQKLDSFRDGAKIIKTILKLGFELHKKRMLYLISTLLLAPGILILGLGARAFFGLLLVLLGIQGLTLYIIDIKTNKAAVAQQ